MAHQDVGARDSVRGWQTGSMLGRTPAALLTAAAMLLAGCGPPYLADTYATSTPKPASLDPKDLVRTPVVVLAFMAPAALQGLSPTMSHALSGALAEVSPPIQHPIPRETRAHIGILRCQPLVGKAVHGFPRGNFADRRTYFGKCTAERV